MKKPRVILAFDFGLKHIGIAIGQDISNTSQTFYSLDAEEGEPDWVQLDNIVKAWNPGLFIVGSPFNMDGSESKMKKKSDLFSSIISKRYKIPIEHMDERLSSREAEKRMLNEEGNYFIDSSSDKHSLSAQIILESWFREKT